MNNSTPTLQPPTPQPFATWNPTHGVWETTQLGLYGQPAPCSAIWPTSGWMRNGSAYQHPLVGAPTPGSASSSSPTAKALFGHRWRPTPPVEGETLERGTSTQGARSPSHQIIDLALNGPWLAQQEHRLGDTVVTDREHLHRWGRYSNAIARWEHHRPAPTPALLSGEQRTSFPGVR